MLEKFLLFYTKVDKIIFYSIAAAILSSLSLSLLLFLSLAQLPSEIPLFYSLPWGQQELTSPNEFLILPAIILLITLINLAISWHLHSSQLVLKRILNLASATFTLFILVTAIKILSIFWGN